MAQSVGPPRLSTTQPIGNLFTPPIPQPAQNNQNMLACLVALKSCVESLTGQRGEANNRAVTFRDLVQYGILDQSAVTSPRGSFVGGGGGGAFLPLAGGTMTGSLILVHDPAVPLEAATMQYVDSHTGSRGASGLYRWQTGTTPPPGGSNVSGNNSVQTAITTIYIDHITTDNIDASVILDTIKAGDVLYLQDQTTSAVNRSYNTTGPSVLTGSYYAVPVTYREGSAASIGNNDRIVLSILRGAAANFLPLSGGILTGPGNLTVGGTLNVTGATTLAAATAPTPAPGDNDTSIATTAFVQAAIGAIPTSGVTSFNTRTGAVTLTSLDVTNALTFTPYNATNPAGYQTAAQVTTSLAPYALTSSIPVASTTLPLIEGVATVGTGTTWARADHVHPASGGTSGTSVTISDTPPASPSPGNMWWSSAVGDGQLYLYYADPNTSQWVVANHIGGGPFLALSGGTLSGALTLNGNAASALQAVPLQQLNSAIATSPALNDIGRNLLHNPLFNIQQRGVGPWTTQGYTADRWWMLLNFDTFNGSIVAGTDGIRAAVGDEALTNIMQAVVTGNVVAASYSLLTQLIEGVRRLAGKTVTVSFWAWALATAKLGISLDQQFGTGGSPSAAVTGTGQSVTVTTTVQRFSLTFTLPSVSGKTLGTNNDNSTELNIWFSSGTTQASRAGNIGVQSGTFGLWGVQLEIGSVATPLEKVDPGEDLRRCQRFYQIGVAWAQYSNCTAGTSVGNTYPFPVTMRATPTAVATNNGSAGIGTPTLNSLGPSMVAIYGTVSATGGVNINVNFAVSADL